VIVLESWNEGEGEMDGGKGGGTRLNRMRSETRKAVREVLCDGSSRDVNREHLGGPLRRKMGVGGGVKGVVRMGGVPDGIDTGKEMGSR
jgi:hypothetical protein